MDSFGRCSADFSDEHVDGKLVSDNTEDQVGGLGPLHGLIDYTMEYFSGIVAADVKFVQYLQSNLSAGFSFGPSHLIRSLLCV